MEDLKFIIVESNLVFRDALKAILENEFSAEVISMINCDEDLPHIKKVVEADIIFINLAIAGRNGFETIKRFHWDYPFLKVIAINTYYAEQIYLLKLIEVGMKGCVDGNNISNEIEEAVRKVMQGEIFFSKRVVKKICPNQNELKDY